MGDQRGVRGRRRRLDPRARHRPRAGQRPGRRGRARAPARRLRLPPPAHARAPDAPHRRHARRRDHVRRRRPGRGRAAAPRLERPVPRCDQPRQVVAHAHERGHEIGVEQDAGLALELRERLVDRPRALVGAGGDRARRRRRRPRRSGRRAGSPLPAARAGSPSRPSARGASSRSPRPSARSASGCRRGSRRRPWCGGACGRARRRRAGPGLWRIESGTPTLPMSCIGAASSSVSQSAGGRPIALPRWAQTRLMRVMWRPVSGSRDSATWPSRWTISSCELRRSWVRSRTRRSSIQLSRITSSFSSISSRASTPSIRRTASGCSASTPSRSSAPISTVSVSSTATTVAVRGVRSSTASSPNACPGPRRAST